MHDEYISREAALTALQDSDLFNTTDRQLRAIRELPAADVAEVVRCRDCINYIGSMCFRCGLGHEVSVDADDFCSRGVTE